MEMVESEKGDAMPNKGNRHHLYNTLPRTHRNPTLVVGRGDVMGGCLKGDVEACGHV